MPQILKKPNYFSSHSFMTRVANVTVGTRLLINWRVWRVVCHIPLMRRRGMLVTRQHCASAACNILWQSIQKRFLCHVKIIKLKSWHEFWLKYTWFWSLQTNKRLGRKQEEIAHYTVGKKIRILFSQRKYFENTVFYKFCDHERDTRIYFLFYNLLCGVCFALSWLSIFI